jgi:hypothetical protein
MPSTYTTNGGIELPANGEQSGTWGETVNDNMAIIDRLTNGVGAISLSGTTHTLTTADGTLSDGQYNVLVLGGSPSGTNTITISPNDGEHVYVVKNASGQTATFTQGSGANVSVLNNTTKIIYADGAGAGAAVVDITGALDLGSLIIAGTSVTATAAELNILDGVTSTTAELNILDGVTATAAELNYNDITTLGTVQASKTVTADASGDVLFPDGDKAIFGAGSDLQIYHDGSNSYIDDAGTGSFYIRSNKLYIQKYTGESMAIFTSDGAVDLRYDDAQKLVTTSTGIDVTGTVVADAYALDSIALPSAGTATIFNRNTDNNLYIQTDSGNNVYLLDGSQNTMYTAAPTYHIFAISNAEKMRIDSSGNVGIGTSSPAAKLHVAGTSRFVSGGATSPAITVTQGYINGDISSANFTIGNFGDGSSEMRVGTRGFTTFFTGAVDNATGTERMRIDSSGNVGIGTSSPAAKLQVGWGSDQLQFTNPSAGKKRIGASYTGYVSDNIHASMDLQSAGSSGGDISFNTTPSGGSLTERMRIDESWQCWDWGYT